MIRISHEIKGHKVPTLCLVAFNGLQGSLEGHLNPVEAKKLSEELKTWADKYPDWKEVGG